MVVVNQHWNSHPFYRLHSLIEIADKQQQDLEKEAKRSHLALEKAQKITEKRERAYKAKVEALETQVTFSEMTLWPIKITGKSKAVRNVEMSLSILSLDWHEWFSPHVGSCVECRSPSLWFWRRAIYKTEELANGFKACSRYHQNQPRVVVCCTPCGVRLVYSGHQWPLPRLLSLYLTAGFLTPYRTYKTKLQLSSF